mgnify:CR=1 FL=1
MLAAHANDWRHAVTIAGDALVASGSTTHAYTDAMIDAINELGPYIVIAPGLALAHARPSESVLHTGLSWVGLAEPVEFGHATNDPVTLVIGLAATDQEGHVGIMSSLAGVLADPDAMSRLAAATHVSEVRSLLGEYTTD